VNRNRKLKDALRRVLFELRWGWAYERVRTTPEARTWFVREPDGRRVLGALAEWAKLTQIDESDPLFVELAARLPSLVGGAATVLFRSDEVWDWQLDAIGDYGIRKGFGVAFRKRGMPTPSEVEKRGERWRPYRSVASWYLWRAAELPTVAPAQSKNFVVPAKAGT